MTYGEHPAGWVILRCAGSKTLEIEDFLSENGFLSWTPRRWVRKRLPRRKARVETLVAVLPSYVFVGVDEDLDLKPLMAGLFSYSLVKTDGGEVAVLKDKDLDGLRIFDVREFPHHRRRGTDPMPEGAVALAPMPKAPMPKVPMPKGSEIPVGAAVRFLEGPFATMEITGVVKENKRGVLSVVLHNSLVKVQIGCSLVAIV